MGGLGTCTSYYFCDPMHQPPSRRVRRFQAHLGTGKVLHANRHAALQYHPRHDLEVVETHRLVNDRATGGGASEAEGERGFREGGLLGCGVIVGMHARMCTASSNQPATYLLWLRW